MEEDILYEFGHGSRRRVKNWLNKILRNGVKLECSRIYPILSIRWRRRKIILLPTNIPKPITIYTIYFTLCSISIYSTIVISTLIAYYSGYYIVKKFKLGKR